MGTWSSSIAIFLAEATERILNKSYHGGPTIIMLWQRFAGITGHFGLAEVLAFATLAGGVVLAMIQVRRTNHATAPGRARPQGGDTRAETLVPESRSQFLAREIARLDAAYRSGQMGVGEYERLRPNLKRQLMEALASTLEERGRPS